MTFNQNVYKSNAVAARNGLRTALANPEVADLVRKAKAIPGKEWDINHPLIKAAQRQLMKAGISTTTGFNFYDLRGPSLMLFPINTPFISMIPKKGKVNAGVGTAAHWKATRNPNATNVYVGAVEGMRGGIATPDMIDYLATYKELAMEGGNTFTSQYASEGLTDVMADEHFRNLARLRLGEEMMTLLGNSGTGNGNLGFALGQPVTPTIAAAAGGTITNGTNCSVAVVAITGMGLNPGGQGGYFAQPTVATGLTTSAIVDRADGGKLTVNGGTSRISAMSAVVATTSSNKQMLVSTTAVKGASAYAWFLNTTDATNPTLANAKLAAITNWPSATLSAVATGTQTGAAVGLDTDHSFQTTDFDGLLTYAFNYGLWTDMNGTSLTPIGNGMVKEIEADLEYLWQSFQAQPDAIWCSADTRLSLDQAVMYSSTGTNSYIVTLSKGEKNNIEGGLLVTGYKSKYAINPDGGSVIPIRLHPMLPPGTIYYDINSNPYPHSRVPGVREFLTQRDYYSIEWPVTTRQYTYGTYIHEVLAHYMPWVSAIRTGVGPFVHP